MKRAAVDPRAEERAAREKQRQALRALARARKVQAKEASARRREMIREELARPRAKRCRCGIRPSSSWEELRALDAGCTAGLYVCPVLDAVRRRW